MRRTQLYFNEETWKKLHIHSRRRKKSISELVREAVHEKYGSPAANRKEAMIAIVGMWKDRDDLPETEQYVRQLRKSRRLKRIFR